MAKPTRIPERCSVSINERMDRERYNRKSAKALGMTQEEFAHYKARLRQNWEEGGGWEGARERLAFAEDYLNRHRTGESELPINQNKD